MLVRPCLRFSVHLFSSRRRLCLRMSWASSVWPRHATMVSGGKPCESLPLTSPPAVNSCFTSAQLLSRVTLPRVLCSMTLRSSSVALFVAAAVVEFVVVLKNPHQAVQEVAADSTEHKNQAVINMDCSSRHAAMVDDGLIPANFSRKKWGTACTKRASLKGWREQRVDKE